MDLQCYLDWCPVSTLPIDNVTIADYGQTRRRAKRAGIIDPLLTRSPELQSYEYTVRSDGLMLLRLGFDDNAAQERRIQIARDSSNTAKKIAGHIHDFHTYYTRNTSACKTEHAHHSPARYPKNLDAVLAIDPVEIDKTTMDNESSLLELDTKELRILVGDDNNVWLRGLYAVTDPMDQSSEPPRPEHAMLKLRRHFAIKKDQVIQSLYRERTRAAPLSWISSLLCFAVSISFLGWLLEDWQVAATIALVLSVCVFVLPNSNRRKPKQEQSKAAPKAWENSLLSFVGLLLLLSWPLEGWLPASTVALIVSFGIFVLTDLTERASKLEMLQRAIGYFAYANVYFRLMDNLYESPQDTGGLEDARHMLEANYLIEKDVIHKRRTTLWMLFTIVTLSAALIKAYSLSPELLR